MNQLFRRKSVTVLLAEAKTDEYKFNRALTARNLITLGIGAIIGTGIFVLTGTAAANYAGPSIVFSFIFSLEFEFVSFFPGLGFSIDPFKRVIAHPIQHRRLLRHQLETSENDMD